MKHILKVILSAVLVILIIGICCYKNLSPIDAVTGASSPSPGLQEGGALSQLIQGESR